MKIRIAATAYGRCSLLKYLTLASKYRTLASTTPLELYIVIPCSKYRGTNKNFEYDSNNKIAKTSMMKAFESQLLLARVKNLWKGFHNHAIGLSNHKVWCMNKLLQSGSGYCNVSAWMLLMFSLRQNGGTA